MIELKNVTKRYENEEKNALTNINLNFPNNGLVGIIGESGSGKSTILNLLGGLDAPTQGEILFNGKAIKNQEMFRNKNISYVFQDYNLFDKMTVNDNINILNHNTSEEEIDIILKKFDIYKYKNTKAEDLSGGEKQRVAIVRALVKNPKIILCDEPTGSLDSVNTKIIFELLKELSKDILIILVSHNEKITHEYADKIIKLNHGIIKSIEDEENLGEKSVEFNNNLHKMGFKRIWQFVTLNRNSLNKNYLLSFIILIIASTLCIISLSLDNNIFGIDSIKVAAKSIKYNGEKFLKYKLLERVAIHPNEEIINNFTNSIKNKNKIQMGKLYYKDGNPLTLEFGDKDANYVYYSNDLSYLYFYQLNDYSIPSDYSVLGDKPHDKDEIMIYQTLADYFIYYGITIKNNSNNKEVYMPKNYEDIVGLKNIVYGDSLITISGIIQEDLSSYEKYKNMDINKIKSAQSEIKLNIFYNNIIDHSRYVYVTDNFDEYIRNFTNKGIDATIYSNLKAAPNSFDNRENINGNYKIKNLDLPFEITDEDKFNYSFDRKIISKLRENEIIIPRELFNRYESKILKNDKLLNLSVNEYYFIDLKARDEFKIVGISDDETFYFCDKVIDLFTIDEYQYIEFYTINNNIKEIETNLRNISNSGIEPTSYFIEPIEEKINTITTYYDIIQIMGILFFILSIVLLFDYIVSYINVNMRNVAILKCLGVSFKEIKGIFVIELYSLIVKSLIFGIISSIIIFLFANKIISFNLCFEAHLLQVNILCVLFFVFIYIFIIKLITFIILSRVKKINAVDLFRE